MSDPQISFNQCKKAAKQGSAEAQTQLGLHYENGRGVKKNQEKALKWYRAAVKQGDTLAQYHLKYFYLTNVEGGQDDEREDAFNWFDSAVQQGNPDALFISGMNHKNQGFYKSTLESAKNTYEEAVKQGHVAAQYHLGTIYEMMAPWNPDLDYSQKALTCFLKAAQQGDDKAQYRLGEIYFNGSLGEPKDAAKAYSCYEAAAVQGNPDAQYHLIKFFNYSLGNDIAFMWCEKAATQGHALAQRDRQV